MKSFAWLSRMLGRLDSLIVFNPGRWPRGEWISRATALAIIAAFLTLRLVQFDRFPQSLSAARDFYAAFVDEGGRPLHPAGGVAFLWSLKLAVWTLETAIYMGYIAAYVSRARAVDAARGFMETAFPVIVAGLPMLIALAPFNLPRWLPYADARHLAVYGIVLGLMTAGAAVNLAGLLALRRAFTIMTEARALITTGLFRFVRHPLYAGHFLLFLGSTLLRLHWYTVLLYVLFCIGQFHRARIEERKLALAFPEFREYQCRTGMFWPRLNQGSKKAKKSKAGDDPSSHP